MDDSLSISVLILANHIDERFEKCLRSVSWAGEVLIGWTNENPLSKAEHDTLKNLVPQLKVIHIPGKITDFAATRNSIQSKSKFNWMFWLDSDEVVLPESIPHITKLISSQQVGGAMIRRLDTFAGKTLRWGEVRDVRIVRVFQKTSGMFIRPVHEVAKVDGEVIDPGIVVEHFAHSSISSFLTKVISYSQIEANLRYKQGRRTSTLELIVWPIGKFIHNMFFRFAFLDGWQGVAYATIMSFHSLSVRACLLELESNNAER